MVRFISYPNPLWPGCHFANCRKKTRLEHTVKCLRLISITYFQKKMMTLYAQPWRYVCLTENRTVVTRPIRDDFRGKGRTSLLLSPGAKNHSYATGTLLLSIYAHLPISDDIFGVA